MVFCSMIKVLNKADGLLQLVTRHAPVSFTELLHLSKLNKATLSQILKSMTELFWIERNEDGRFRIGQKLALLAKSHALDLKLRDMYYKTAEKLSREINELVSISVFYDGRRHLVVKHETDHFVKINESSSSTPESMFTTATGLVLLSGLDKDVRDVFIARNNFEVEIKHARKYLDDIRGNGFGELALGSNDGISLAVGVYDSSNKMIASIGFSAPCYRFTMNKEAAVKLLKEAANDISSHI